MTFTETKRDNEIAMILIGTWGSTSYPPKQWDRWAWAETEYAPEWLGKDDLNRDREECDVSSDDCVTVLDFSLSEVEPPPGYVVAYQYAAGEHECPWCSESYRCDDSPKQEDCKLCEGDGYIYWGEECQVVVFAPIFTSQQFQDMADGLCEASCG